MTSKEELVMCRLYARDESMMRPMSRVATRVAVSQTGAPSSQFCLKSSNVLVNKVVVDLFNFNCFDSSYRNSASPSPGHLISIFHAPFSRLLQWNESRRVCSADTWSTVFDRFAIQIKISPSVRASHRILLVPHTMRY